MTSHTSFKPLFVPGRRICYACAHDLTGTEKLCYACANGLLGEPKDNWGDEEWECRCMGDEWQCECENAMMCYCPICGEQFAESSYLATVFADDERARWLANMVTHYRHQHRAWDRTHGYLTRRYGQDTYERQKAIINEQAKRQIVRKASDYLRAHGISVEVLQQLQGTTAETIEVATKNYQLL